MGNVRRHIVIPDKLARDIEALAGKRGWSAFITETMESEVRRRKLLSILERSEPFWDIKKHPELRRGAAAWVRNLRRENDRLRNR
jgi:hypothetical protein